MTPPRVRIQFARGRYHIRWFCEDTDAWREILRDFKYEFAQWERRFDAVSRTWSVPLDCRARVRAWACRWFDADSREYTEEEPAGCGYGGRTYSDTRNSYGRYGKTPAGTSAIEAAFATLHLLPSAPAWATEAVYKAAVRVHHPDAGGDGQTMVRINLAMERIREHQEEKAS